MDAIMIWWIGLYYDIYTFVYCITIINYSYLRMFHFKIVTRASYSTPLMLWIRVRTYLLWSSEKNFWNMKRKCENNNNRYQINNKEQNRINLYYVTVNSREWALRWFRRITALGIREGVLKPQPIDAGVHALILQLELSIPLIPTHPKTKLQRKMDNS